MPKGNLLLIDDEQLIIENMSNILEDCADKIFIANSGEKGLDILSREVIHCVVCDINMPEINGVDVIRMARKKNIHVPFIFYTGHGGKHHMLEAIKYGAFDFLDKPDLEGLKELVLAGLAHGLNGDNTESEPATETTYRKLLKNLERQGKK